MHSKRTIKFDFLKRINTNYSKFDKIIYLINDHSDILIEDPKHNKCYRTSGYNLGNHIHLKNKVTEWKSNLEGNYCRFSKDNLEEIVPVFDEIKYLNFRFAFARNKLCTYKKLIKKTSNFSLDIKENLCFLKCRLPMFPIYIHYCNGRKRIIKIYMKINNCFYQFPYGNVNNNSICFGRSNKETFESIEEFYISFFTTTFNNDYSLNLKSNTESHFKFDLDLIHNKIQSDIIDNIHVIEMLYYLSEVTHAENLDVSKIFFKILKMPWETN